MDTWLNWPFQGAWLVALILVVMWLVIAAAKFNRQDARTVAQRRFGLEMDSYARAWDDYMACRKSRVHVCSLVLDESCWSEYEGCLAEIALDGSLRVFRLEEPDDYGSGYVCQKVTVVTLKPRQWMEFKTSGPAADAAAAKARGAHVR